MSEVEQIQILPNQAELNPYNLGYEFEDYDLISMPHKTILNNIPDMEITITSTLVLIDNVYHYQPSCTNKLPVGRNLICFCNIYDGDPEGMFEIRCRDGHNFYFSELVFDIVDYNEGKVMQIMTRKNVSSLQYLSHDTLPKEDKLEIITWHASLQDSLLYLPTKVSMFYFRNREEELTCSCNQLKKFC